MVHRHTKAGQSAARYPGWLTPAFLLFYFLIEIVRFVRRWPRPGRLWRIDRTPPFIAEHQSSAAASISYTSQTWLGFSFSLARRKSSMLNAFFGSASAVYL